MKKNEWLIVGFEVLTAVVMKSIIFWGITQCSLLKVIGRFGGTYRLHLQGRRISRARNQLESRWKAPAFTMVAFQRSTRYYIPEDRTLQMVNRLNVRKNHKKHINSTCGNNL
jgi:hypothetical protein